MEGPLKNIRHLAVVLALGLAPGCTAVASGIADVGASLSTQTVAQVTTLDEAEKSGKLVADGATFAVQHDTSLTVPVLLEVQALSAAVSKALDDLDADQVAGKSLSFSAFNAAVDGYNAYVVQKGVQTH